MKVLDGVEDVAICRLKPEDVVRHVLVQRIIAAYEKYGEKEEKRIQQNSQKGGKKK